MSDVSTGLEFLDEARWLNPPADSRRTTDGGLTVTTAERTDFWRSTHYGFIRDNGHFLGAPAKGDFTAEVAFEADYRTLYDQAGLMLRIDEATWIKAGIEYSDEATNFSVVVTRERSDWSVNRRPRVTGVQQLRLTRIGSAVLVQALDGQGRWDLLRLADFPDTPDVTVGVMACTPERTGLQVTFKRFTVGPAVADALHG
ncbi:MAG TPA: DUF1349 domain-containing protein [Methylomirabilota bacterium]|nr:DUF1349 domain-containing protein [Methylomirabilota bacterium]